MVRDIRTTFSGVDGRRTSFRLHHLCLALLLPVKLKMAVAAIMNNFSLKAVSLEQQLYK